MRSVKDFCFWFYKTDVFQLYRQKNFAFYHNKDIAMLKPGCKIPNLTNIGLHEYTKTKFCLLRERERERGEICLKNFRKFVVGAPFFVCTRRAVVDSVIRKSSNGCKDFVRIEASDQFYASSMCKRMPIGLFKRLNFNSEMISFTPRASKVNGIKIWTSVIFYRHFLTVELKNFIQLAGRIKMTAFVLKDFFTLQNSSKHGLAFTSWSFAKNTSILNLVTHTTS